MKKSLQLSMYRVDIVSAEQKRKQVKIQPDSVGKVVHQRQSNIQLNKFCKLSDLLCPDIIPAGISLEADEGQGTYGQSGS
jgi:hypothetical protein